jgi:hypothetical protein
MKEITITKEVAKEQLKEHWFEVEDPYISDEAKAIDFNFPCADWFAVFSGMFKDISSFHKWLECDDCQMDVNLIYYVDKNEVLLVFGFLEKDYTYSYVTITGSGKDYLIQKCEECCQEEYEQTCEEFIRDSV